MLLELLAEATAQGTHSTLFGIPLREIADGGISLVFLLVILHVLLIQLPATSQDIKSTSARFTQSIAATIAQFRAETLEIRIADARRSQEMAAIFKSTLDDICARHEKQIKRQMELVEACVRLKGKTHDSEG